MEQRRRSDPAPPGLAAALDAAAEVLVMVWGRAVESLTPRVSGSQLRALLVVERRGELNLNGLADALGSIPSSASRLCDRLQAAGLLARTPGRDRREVVLRLTPDGVRLLAAMRTRRQADLGDVLAGMAPQHRDDLVSGLTAFGEAAAPPAAQLEEPTA